MIRIYYLLYVSSLTYMIRVYFPAPAPICFPAPACWLHRPLSAFPHRPAGCTGPYLIPRTGLLAALAPI